MTALRTYRTHAVALPACRSTNQPSMWRDACHAWQAGKSIVTQSTQSTMANLAFPALCFAKEWQALWYMVKLSRLLFTHSSSWPPSACRIKFPPAAQNSSPQVHMSVGHATPLRMTKDKKPDTTVDDEWSTVHSPTSPFRQLSFKHATKNQAPSPAENVKTTKPQNSF